MANSETADANAPVPKSSKKVLILIILAFLAALAIGSGITFFLVNRQHQAQSEDEDEEEVVVEKPKKAERKKPVARETPAPVYTAMDAFTVNLVPENGEQFLHVVLSVEISDAPVGDKIKSYTPKLRNNIMLLLSSKKPSELMSKDGKQQLANEIRSLMNEIIEPGSSRDRPEYAPVIEVLFTTFIIQ
ncbi:MAG: flagellar basal body-associated FliL family protein [Candidatus Accumulibacter sp.]|jgi:flagellar FliL protein|nr:flagellar basal body-associated FliL family protein [Accumulibacter sp.]